MTQNNPEPTQDVQNDQPPLSRYPVLREATIRAEPDLSPDQRETIVRFADADDVGHVYSENTSVMRGLVAHPKFHLTELRVSDENRFGARLVPDAYENESIITGVKGSIYRSGA